MFASRFDVEQAPICAGPVPCHRHVAGPLFPEKQQFAAAGPTKQERRNTAGDYAGMCASRKEYHAAAGSKRCIDGCLDRGAIVGHTIPKRPVVLDVEIEQLRRQYQVIGLATPTHPMFSPSAACLTHKADATPLGLP